MEHTSPQKSPQQSFAVGSVVIPVLQKSESSQSEVPQLEGAGPGLQAGEGHSPSQEAKGHTLKAHLGSSLLVTLYLSTWYLATVTHKYTKSRC